MKIITKKFQYQKNEDEYININIPNFNNESEIVFFGIAKVPAGDKNKKFIDFVFAKITEQNISIEDKNMTTPEDLEKLFGDFLYSLNRQIYSLIESEEIDFDKTFNILLGAYYLDEEENALIVSFTETGNTNSIILNFSEASPTNQKTIQPKPDIHKVFPSIVSGSSTKDQSILYYTGDIGLKETNKSNIEDIISSKNDENFAAVLIYLQNFKDNNEKESKNSEEKILESEEEIKKNNPQIKEPEPEKKQAYQSEQQERENFKPKNKIKLKSRKIFIALAFIALSFLILNIVNIRKENTKEEDYKKYEVLTQEIENKKNELELYIDTIKIGLDEGSEKAQEALKELEILLKKIPEEFKSEKVKSIANETEKFAKEIYKINQGGEPEIIYDFSKLSESALLKIAKIKENFYVINEKNEIFFLLNNKSAEKVVNENLKGEKPIGMASGEENIIILYPENQIAAYNIESKTLSPSKITYPLENIKISEIAIWGKKLYTFDNENNEIYKHEFTSEGFGEGTYWLNDGENTENIISAMIDGSIYAMDSGGNIIEYFRGSKKDFELEKIRPIFSAPLKIFTGAEMANLYILDPKEQRIVIFNKKGSLTSQYIHNEFSLARDFIVSQNEKIIYILTDKKLLDFKVE